MATKKKTEKNVVVDRKFLLRLADTIYNEKTKNFLKLCTGELQLSTDSEIETSKPMHCGLGELYFQMTGHHPYETGIDEDGVIRTALAKSTIVKPAVDAIQSLSVSIPTKEHLVETFVDAVEEEGLGLKFSQVLNQIPGKNDDGEGNAVCTPAKFAARSKRVASVIRKAANVLPQ